MINVVINEEFGQQYILLETNLISITIGEISFDIYCIGNNILSTKRTDTIRFNPKHIAYNDFKTDYKAKIAALRGFVRTEKIDIELPALPETLGNIFVVNRNNEYGEILNIVNQCKCYIRSLIAYCTKERIAAIQSLFEVVKAQMYVFNDKNGATDIIIDNNDILKSSGLVWELLSNSWEYIDGDFIYTSTIRFAYPNNIFSIIVEYDKHKIREIKLI